MIISVSDASIDLGWGENTLTDLAPLYNQPQRLNTPIRKDRYTIIMAWA
jgi:hypothetical protein